MDMLQAIEKRHSVRSYTDQPIEGSVLDHLTDEISRYNRESGLSMTLRLNNPGVFDGFLARYGKFENVRNYLALIGTPDTDFDEKCGYYGQKIVLAAQQMGLNSCWVGGTYSKRKAVVELKPGEKLRLVITLGYGSDQGKDRQTKPIADLCEVDGDMPDWFKRGMEAVQLAPTAMNQQKFLFRLEHSIVSASAGRGFYAGIDLGIAKCHFEIGAYDGEWEWAQNVGNTRG